MPVVEAKELAIHHDLLYIQDDRLMRWKSASNETEVLLGDGPVWDYVLTADQKHAAVVLHQQGKDVLGMFHLESKALDVLVPVTRIWPTQWWPRDRHWFKPSPDGRWIVYFQSEDHGATGKLMLLSTLIGESSQSAEIGFCGRQSANPELSPDCRDFIWTPDSKALLWSDGMGEWFAVIGKSPKQIRTVASSTLIDIRSGSVRRFLDWSPYQQFLLVEIGFYEGSAQAVFDIARGQFRVVPDTGIYTHVAGQSIWLNDNSVMAVSFTDSSLVLRRFNVVKLTESLDLRPSHEVAFSAVVPPANIESITIADADKVNAVVSSEVDSASYWQHYLYRFNVAQANAKPPIALPAELSTTQYLFVNWSPDGQTALIFNHDDIGLYLISTVDEAAVKISTMLKGKEPPHRFEWLR